MRRLSHKTSVQMLINGGNMVPMDGGKVLDPENPMIRGGESLGGRRKERASCLQISGELGRGPGLGVQNEGVHPMLLRLNAVHPSPVQGECWQDATKPDPEKHGGNALLLYMRTGVDDGNDKEREPQV